MSLMRNIPVWSGEDFTWEKNVGTSDASEFNGYARVAGQVFDDAADAGFYVMSHRTGRQVLFIESGADRDDENEVTAYVYQAYDPKTKRDLPYFIKLWND